MEKYTKIGCEAFILRDEEILLGLRKNCFGENTWGLPGGHLEFGERAVSCLLRELKEEVGIDFLENDTRLSVVSDGNDGNKEKHYIHLSFEVKYDGQPVILMEPDHCYEWKFFNIHNLPPNIFVSHIGIINKYKNKKLY